MAVSAVVGAYAAYDAGQTNKEFAEYEGKQISADAKAEAGAAQVEADRIREMGKRAAAEANVAIAGSGQTLGSAGALAINKEIYRGSEEDAYFALVGGKDRSARMNAQSQLTDSRGQAAGKAGTIGAFSTLLGGASAAGQQYNGWKKAQQPSSGGVGGGGG